MNIYIITRHRMGSFLPECDPELINEDLEFAKQRAADLDAEWGSKARHYVYELGEEVEQ